MKRGLMNRKHHLNRLTVTISRRDGGAGIYPKGLYSQKNKEKLKHKESSLWALKAHEATQEAIQLSFQDSTVLWIIMERKHLGCVYSEDSILSIGKAHL